METLIDKIQHNKVLIIGILFFLLLLLIGILLFLRARPAQPIDTETPLETTSVTEVPLPATIVTTDPEAPVAIPPDRTGGLDPSFSPQQEANIEQERGLKRRLPYVTNDFSIRYNYNTDRFEVELTGGTKETAMSWLESNYPAIEKTRFTFLN